MKSMTGFGRGSAHAETTDVTLELSSVNRKQAEVVVQGLRDHPEVEIQLRKAVLARISRGRLQVSVSFQTTNQASQAIHIDPGQARQIQATLQELAEVWNQPLPLTVSDLFKFPNLLRFEESTPDPHHLWQAIHPALKQALAQLDEMRSAEGSELAADLAHRLHILKSLTGEIEAQAAHRPLDYRKVLLKRLSDMDLELDLADDRVLREVAIFADRCDISEEVTRLTAHFNRFQEYLDSAEPAGRPLDFLCQEIHREFNTIGSKAYDAAIAQHVVTAKTELEKIREQVQNLE